MTEIEIDKELARIGEALSSSRLDELKRSVPPDAETICKCAKKAIEEYSFLVEAAIIEGCSGNEPQSVLFHKLSYNCMQIVGAMIELSRNEGVNEYYLTPRTKKPESL